MIFQWFLQGFVNIHVFLTKSRSKSHLGRSWGDLGAVLGRSWAVLGPSWVRLEPFWDRLGDFWGGLTIVNYFTSELVNEFTSEYR